MDFPNELFYSNDHEWVKVDGKNAYIGISAHAASELGDVVYIDIESDLDKITKGEVFGTIEAVKTVADLVAPISGKVLEVNAPLNDAPDTVNNDPYGNGWMVKVEIADEAELNDLMKVDAYKAFIGE